MLGKVEQNVDDRINDIKNIVSDPAKELEKAYNEWENQKELIKQEATDEEKKVELRKLLDENEIKYHPMSWLSKLTEVAKQAWLLE